MKNPPLHRYATRPGLYFTDDGGADAVVRSETADRIWLCVYEPLDRPSAFYNEAVRLFKGSPIPWTQEVRLFPICSRIIESMYVRETLFAMSGPNYGLWYVHLPKAWDGMRYAYRVDGQWNPTHDVRFNPHKILLDPYGKGIDGTMKLDASAFSYECTIDNGVVHGSPDGNMSTLDSLGSMPVSVAIDDRDTTKHEGEPSHPHVPWSKTVIYELHVKGFTANAPWLPPELRGTYAGLAHPATLSYLQTLGVTSIELLPIQAKQDELFLQQRGRHNYWGYSTLGYFAPEPSYATQAAQRSGPRAVRQEVIDMVRALHEAGFEVIMDVVYNHTCEGGTDGPTVCWRGLDELSYYRHQRNNPSRLEDTTGCGNTLDFSNTHVVTFAIDSLRYWAKRIGVDGFRFDLAASLARLDGNFTKHHPFLYALRSDMLLGNLKLIMEPWDVGYQGWRTGQFGMPFGEWNDAFRNSVRQFWLTDPVDRPGNGETGMQEMATRLCGSADLFATEPGRGAPSSINFISCHDRSMSTSASTYAGALPGPTPSAGLPEVYAALTMPGPPVARIVATPSWRMRAPVASMDGCSIHWIQFSGAPAAMAASRTILAAATEHFCANGWKPKTIGHRVLSAIKDLKIAVEVGLVTGVTPATTPTGSAISSIPRTSSERMMPTVFCPAR